MIVSHGETIVFSQGLQGMHVSTDPHLCLRQIAGYVNQPMVDVSILQRSLAILESMVLNSHSLYHRVAQEITVGQLIGHLQV